VITPLGRIGKVVRKNDDKTVRIRTEPEDLDLPIRILKIAKGPMK